MRAAIDVADRAEADRIKAALEDGTTRAVVNVVGLLLPLAPEDRRTVIAYATKLAAATDSSLLGSSAIDLPDAINRGRV